MATTTSYINALTLDLDDGLVPGTVHRLLDLLDAHALHATLFAAGALARRQPGLMRRIAAAGHELASHGYAPGGAAHTRCQFRRDIMRAKGVLEDSTGRAVLGYRAPAPAPAGSERWAMDLLYQHGYRYSAGNRPAGGTDSATPRMACYPCGPHGILALPLATLHLGRCQLAWRCAPALLAQWMLRQINQRDRMPAVVRLLPAPLCERPAGLRALAGPMRWDRIDRLFPVLP